MEACKRSPQLAQAVLTFGVPQAPLEEFGVHQKSKPFVFNKLCSPVTENSVVVVAVAVVVVVVVVVLVLVAVVVVVVVVVAVVEQQQ